ncbi:hypothetical protein [Streptantibioticus silvisoli]|uniref:Uncharacterized protein n=1 Tax=Streptantibioticus silvisoli TaxID=2705255 RepID=A0ABT6W287_9ACTN|nr:hypothetical protein [Streptantibioticus silvisoli]MDI5964835.1 hypothetical protein [Streptantibioticus silvisoli]
MTIIDSRPTTAFAPVSTPTMYHPQDDGTLILIPAADAAVLDRYRDGDEPTAEDWPVVARYYPVMPLVYEPQFFGDPFPLYPLIDEVTETECGGLSYICYPMPGTVTKGPGGSTTITVTMGPESFTPRASGVAA